MADILRVRPDFTPCLFPAMLKSKILDYKPTSSFRHSKARPSGRDQLFDALYARDYTATVAFSTSEQIERHGPFMA